MRKAKGIDGKLDIAWSRLVKLEWGSKCAKCGKRSPLNSHHIFSRSNRSVRWDTDNGICLCVGCHTFSSKFSAHKTPTEFTYWLESIKGKEWMQERSIKAHKTMKWTKAEKEELLEELNKRIKKFGTNK
jgi:hypothetical protein